MRAKKVKFIFNKVLRYSQVISMCEYYTVKKKKRFFLKNYIFLREFDSMTEIRFI